MKPWVLRDGNQYRLYKAGDENRGTYRISLATSNDGLTGKRHGKTPVFAPMLNPAVPTLGMLTEKSAYDSLEDFLISKAKGKIKE